MLIPELKELLKKYKKEELSLIIAEMYKAMPKKLREEKGIDNVLNDFSTHKSKIKPAQLVESDIDVEALKREIEIFVEHAYKQYYFAPNKFVHKSERENWKVTIKSYLKDLQKVPVDSDMNFLATELLFKLYAMLSYACSYYIFKTESPFRAVGIKQVTMLETLIARRLRSGVTPNNIKSVISLVIDHGGDRVTSHETLIWTLIQLLKTPDLKMVTAEQCDMMKAEIRASIPASSKGARSIDTTSFKREEKIRHLVMVVFLIKMELGEYGEAIQYFSKNYVYSNAEVSLYILLELLWQFKAKDYWLQQYDLAVKKGITPRKELADIRQYINDKDRFPE